MDEVSLKFDERVAVVTGAAGNIGLATCRMFCESGVKVAATDLSAEVIEERIAPLKEQGFDIRAYTQDVTDREALRSSFAQIISDFGKIDILVNNAGVWNHRDVPGRQRFEEMNIEEIRRIVDINFYGVVNCLQLVIPHMAERKYGRIINLGSIAGEVGLPGYADYAACKAAVIKLTETLAMENAKLGITVNSVSPGMIHKTVMPNDGTWLGRSGSPDDIARAILFLASDTAAYMTGVDLPVDGGRILGPHNANF
jgi:NAD(P)-dependent dehydrogenase (short-subunit alcohol dehydrogenase family)